MNSKNTNQKNLLLVILLLIIFSASLTVSLMAQSERPTQSPKAFEELWINIPSSPLEVRLNSSRRYTLLNNRSSARVIGYKFGCVARSESSKIRILRKLATVDTDLEPD